MKKNKEVSKKDQNYKMKKIVIIDDEESILEVYSVALAKSGYKVFTASNGKMGVEVIENIQPDLILLDVVMPTSDGFDVLKKLKNDPDLSFIPVILLTNLVNQEDKECGYQLGAADYLIKVQYSPKKLVEKVGKFFVSRED